MIVQLTKHEVATAIREGANRHAQNVEAGVSDQIQDRKQSPIDIHVLGFIGEYAFTKGIGRFMSLDHHPRSGTPDYLTSKGKKVDIKATKNPTAGLLVKITKNATDADAYVLGIYNEADYTVNFVGFASAADIINDQQIKDSGNGPYYFKPANELRAVEARFFE